MLRQVIIYKDGEKIYQQNFGKALDDDSFKGVMNNIEKDAFKSTGETVQYHDFYKYRISYVTEPEKKIIFLFTTDLSDKFENIKKQLLKCKKEFLMMFEGVLEHKFDDRTFDVFEPTIESIHKALRPKISLVGFSGVGKTTITRLIRAEEIPVEHIPTITGDIATIKIGNLHFHLWDFAGQEQFSFLWNNFIQGSDAVLLISDSTLENCEKSKFFIDLIGKEAEHAHTAVIGNKQDLPDALPIADIERILGLKGYSMVATDPDNRDKMITIIADVLEMSSEVSPLLKPLIERDKKVAAAEQALEDGDFQRAVDIFEDVADLCITLGDDVVSQEFFEKAEKIRKILQSIQEKGGSAAAPASASTPKAAAPPKPAAPPEPGPKKPAVGKPKKPEALPAGTSAKTNLSKPTPPPAKKLSKPSSKSRNSNLDKLNQMLKGMGGDSKIPKAKPANGPSVKALKPAVSTSAPASSGDSGGKSSKDIDAEIMELNLKINKIKNKLVDLEMENIMGELSDEDYKAKETRMTKLIDRLQGQISELKKMK